nr:hypothetical protein [Tanacetum cinerariifolium]
MASFDYRLNPLYPIKECSSCGALYTTDYCCSDGSLRDKIIYDLNKTPELFQEPLQNCPKCGNPVDGHYCQGCPILQKKFKEYLFTYCIENGILKDSSEPSNDNTNVVNALQESFIIEQDPGENSSQSPPQINHHCCYECGDSLEDIFFHQCTCELCEKGAHYGYNCSPKVLIIPDPEPFNNQTIDELSQTVPSLIQHTILKKGIHPLMIPHLILFMILLTFLTHLRNLLCIPMNFARTMLIPVCYDDDDEDYTIAVTPIVSTDEPNNSLRYSQQDVSKDQFEDFSDSNDESTSIDYDSFSIDDIEYVEASPPDSELVSSEVMEIVIPKVGRIDDDILLTIKDDILHEKLLNINLLIANIEALKDNPTPSFDFMTKSSSTSLNFLLDETNTVDNSLPESKAFCFDLEKTSSGSTTTRSNISLPEYEAFYDDHVKEISSGSTTTHSDFSLYDSFIFDHSINLFPPANKSDFLEFADDLAHIISPSEYDCFCFNNEPNSGDFTMDVVGDIFPTREPRVYVHNALPTHPNRQLNLDFILSSESLFTYVVWIFLPFLLYSVSPQYILTFGNEDTIFDPDIYRYHIFSFMPDVSRQSGTFIKFNVLNESSMEILISTCSLMDQ